MSEKSQWDYLEVDTGDDTAKILEGVKNTTSKAEVTIENLAQFVDLQEAERVLLILRNFVEGKRTGYPDATSILAHMDRVLQVAKDNGVDISYILEDFPSLKQAARVRDLERTSRQIDLELSSEGNRNATFSATLQAFKNAIDEAEGLNIDVADYRSKFEKVRANAVIQAVIM